MKNHAHSMPTLREIREAHGWKREYEQYLPLSRYFFRPVGFRLTWAAIRAGWTSEGVSWLSGLVGLAGCALLISGSQQLLPAGIGLLFLFNLLDCVDGSIARSMKTQNPYGRFLDSVCGGVIDLAFWGIIGIMAFQHPPLLQWPDPFGYGSMFWLAIGGTVCFLYLLLGLLESRFDELLRPFWRGAEGVAERPEAQPAGSEIENRKPWPLRLIVATNLRVRETHYALLLAAWWVGAVDLLLLLYLAYYFLHDAFIMTVYVKRGRGIRGTYPAAKTSPQGECHGTSPRRECPGNIDAP
jgi:phosphatidylglycerophosphate synthase